MNKDLMHAREKRYRQSDQGRAMRKAAQARRRLDPAPSRDWRLKRYGLSQADFDAMTERQANTCAICFRPATQGQWGKLRVDHDHTTGKVRGLLCHHCNVALGHLGDSIPILENAIAYLRANGASADGWPHAA